MILFIRVVFFFILFIPAQNIMGQNKQDYIWLFGHDSDRNVPGIESYIFDFNFSSQPDSARGILPIQFSGNNASICDKEGKLLFYSNGCHIAGADHNILPNGSGLNEGNVITLYLQDTCSYYPAPLNIMVLPHPDDNDRYHVIHKRAEYDGDLYHDNILATTIDRSLNNGLGDVVSKNIDIIDSTRIQSRYLTAVLHQNGVDWWIINPMDRSDAFVRILLDNNGFNQLPDLDSYAPSFQEFSSSSGSAFFSPDGNHYAYFNVYDNLLLYDFNRETGILSNLRQLKISDIRPPEIVFSSIEWSSNSRFLYIAITDELWQLDTREQNLEDGLQLIDIWNGVQDPFHTTFHLMALAPDCRIYMCSGSGTNTYHVINKPNEKGTACDFVQQGIRLPFVSARGNLPNFPRFRVDDNEKCDPTITTFLGEDIYFRHDLEVFPNPASDYINIKIPDNLKGYIYVFDVQGQLVLSKKDINAFHKVQLDLSSLQGGMYSIEFLPVNHSEKSIYTAWVNKSNP